MENIDFGQVAKSYARSREDIPISLMESLYIRGILFDGRKVADVGCGTGALTRKMAMRKADVIGVEPSKNLIEMAQLLNRLKNYQIPYLQTTAESTRLPDNEFDIVTVMRAWHWFDRPKAIEEMKRILKSSGILVVIDSGFIADSPVVQRTLEVLSNYVSIQPAGSKAASKQRLNVFPVEWFAEWQTYGFEIKDFYKLPYIIEFTKQEWIERIESISWLASLDAKARKKALQDVAETLTSDGLYTIPHECNVCILPIRQ